jgi:hypothetical protein
MYFVFAPVGDKEKQITLAQQFLSNAKQDGDDGKTNIILPKNFYTIATICEGDNPSFSTPKLEVVDENSGEIATMAIDRFLVNLKSSTTTCNASPSAVLELSKYLGDAVKHPENGKLIVFIQIPWTREQLAGHEKDLKTLETSMNELVTTGQIEKIILFGVSQDAAAFWGGYFKAFNMKGSKKFESSTDIGQVKEFLKMVRKNYLDGL